MTAAATLLLAVLLLMLPLIGVLPIVLAVLLSPIAAWAVRGL